jgi:hypothetical protein
MAVQTSNFGSIRPHAGVDSLDLNQASRVRVIAASREIEPGFALI